MHWAWLASKDGAIYTAYMSRTAWALWTVLGLGLGLLLYAWALGVGPWEDPEPYTEEGVRPWMEEKPPQAPDGPDPALLELQGQPEGEGQRTAAEEPVTPALIEGILVRVEPGTDPAQAPPAAGVTVSLRAHRSTLTEPYRVTTDEAGRFAIPIPPPKKESFKDMSCRLFVAGTKAWRSLRQDVKVVLPAEGSQTVRLEQFGYDAIRGRVQDALRAPVVDLELQVVSQGQGALEKGESRTVKTGPDGEFRFAPGLFGELGIAGSGYTLLQDTGFATDERGAFLPRELTVAPHATLEVLLVDPDGQPIVDELVSVRIADHEAHGVASPFDSKKRGWSVRAEADGDGRVRFEGLPAQQCLVVYGPTGGKPRIRADGELVGLEELAPRLRLEPGEVREATITGRSTFSVTIKVLEPDGSPSPSPITSAIALDRQTGRTTGYLDGGFADEGGVREFQLEPVGGERDAFIMAQGRIGEIRSMSPFGGSTPPDPLHAGWALVPLPWTGAPVEIQLGVMEKIGGRVVDSEGQAIQAEVRLRPMQDDWMENQLLSGQPKMVNTSEDGTFLYRAVPPGSYRLTVQGKGFQPTDPITVAAGSMDLEIVVAAAERSRVTIQLHSKLTLDESVFVCSPMQPHREGPLDLPKLAQKTTVQEPRGWPAQATRVWYGSSSYNGPLGRANIVMVPDPQATRTFEVQPGYYWIGGKASIQNGATTFPVGTGLVYVGPGDYHVDLHVGAQGKLAGRIMNFEPKSVAGEELFVALAPKAGPALEVRGRREPMESVHEVSSDGSFRLFQVPVGNWEVRVGPRSVLESGGALRRFPVTIQTGDNPDLECWL